MKCKTFYLKQQTHLSKPVCKAQPRWMIWRAENSRAIFLALHLIANSLWVIFINVRGLPLSKPKRVACVCAEKFSPEEQVWKGRRKWRPAKLVGWSHGQEQGLSELPLSFYSVSLQGWWLEWLSPNYAVIIPLHCNWLGRYANTCHLGW